MKRIVVRLSGMPFDPTYEIDDTVAIGDLVRVPGSNSAFIEDGETGTVIALESSYTGPCKRATRVRRPLKAIGAARSKVSRAGPAEALPDAGTGSHGRHRRLRLEAGERDCEGFGAHPAAQHHWVAPANAFHFVRGASNKLSDNGPRQRQP